MIRNKLPQADLKRSYGRMLWISAGASMVKKQPKVLYRALPAYPDSARIALVEGRVIARVLVGSTGEVEVLDRIEGPLAFHKAVEQAAKKWRFTPAIQNDEAVRLWVSLPFVFELE
jgi:TonB family protein